VKFSIESWAPEYGSAIEVDEREASQPQVDVTVETPRPRWAPISPGEDLSLPETILFTDGVRRVDARVWVDDEPGRARPGICASYAAGAVRCDGRASVVASEVERGLFCSAAGAEAITCRHAIYPVRRPEGNSPEQLSLALQARMIELEATIAEAHDADLVVVDGPLKPRHQRLGGAIGYITSHHVSYLPDELEEIVGQLEPGQRTPAFLIAGRFSRFSWYLRLPGSDGHAWAGIVRCETTGDVELPTLVGLADVTAALLPTFSSHAHKDPRAPQNLYPIAGLERELRRRLGDPALLYRGLRVASVAAA
jgi:hypothetical protein